MGMMHRPTFMRSALASAWALTLAALAAVATLPAAAATATATATTAPAAPAAIAPAATPGNAPAPAPGTALGDLQAFLQQTQHGRAAFTQTVTGPRPAAAPDAAAASAAGAPAARVQTSHGVFEFQRPNRFRFHYQRPFEQLIVADGQTLWLYDPDLAQVTARAQREVLGQTPAALLASGADLRTLQQAFTLSNAPDADGLRWVQAVPKGEDAPLQAVRIGFRNGQLAVLEILDRFGQRSHIAFERLDTQSAFRPGHFGFSVPTGAALIRPE
ncbi:outer membrane lipoprotein-sorting protein [Serpentinimonas raichei]|uniref:Outer-membrane lipoprotein carrier protein n=2 Tax=Serpentinimonas raichei TaxID=1458425 RepID=A0A060NHA6_9BURK|nr:outer membrane lipoprotein-sorting protein [Serpentinimonas raichei]